MSFFKSLRSELASVFQELLALCDPELKAEHKAARAEEARREELCRRWHGKNWGVEVSDDKVEEVTQAWEAWKKGDAQRVHEVCSRLLDAS